MIPSKQDALVAFGKLKLSLRGREHVLLSDSELVQYLRVTLDLLAAHENDVTPSIDIAGCRQLRAKLEAEIALRHKHAAY